MKTLNFYSLALVLCEGKFSCPKMAKTLGLVSHDKLTRILMRGCFDPCSDLNMLPKGGYLIYDDTVIAKPFGNNIEGVGFYYDSAEGKSIRGLPLILIIYVYQQQVFILDVIIPGGGKTKNDIIRQCLKEYKEQGLKPYRVLFDNWYAAQDSVNLLNDLNWVYISRCKKNRILNGEGVQKHKYYGAKAIQGKLKGVYHPVQVVRDGKRYLMTNAKAPTCTVALSKQYSYRWIIETIFRDLKNLFHLEECSSRSLDGQFHHILACLEAYLFIKKANPDKTTESACHEVIEDFRRKKYRQEPFQLMAA